MATSLFGMNIVNHGYACSDMGCLVPLFKIKLDYRDQRIKTVGKQGNSKKLWHKEDIALPIPPAEIVI